MDENDTRIAALKRGVLALTPWINPGVVDDAVATLKTELDAATGNEREVCAQAIQLPTDGNMRFRGLAAGRSLQYVDQAPITSPRGPRRCRLDVPPSAPSAPLSHELADFANAGVWSPDSSPFQVPDDGFQPRDPMSAAAAGEQDAVAGAAVLAVVRKRNTPIVQAPRTAHHLSQIPVQPPIQAWGGSMSIEK